MYCSVTCVWRPICVPVLGRGGRGGAARARTFRLWRFALNLCGPPDVPRAQFHRPRSLALALVGEIGELCELFQWRGDEGAEAQLPDWTEAEKERLGEELSDVLYYTVRLADRCGIDLAAAAERKMEQNIAKYPADRCFGSSAKYTAYQDGSGDSGGDASK